MTDIHIKTPSDTNYHLLLNLIKKIDTSQVKYFILLGDIFDFCFGKSRYFHNKFNLFICALEQLACSKTEVIYLHGNHEFSLESMPWKSVKIVSKQTELISLAEDIKIALCHGDTINAPRNYIFYMSIVRSNIFQTLTSFIPGFIVDKICLKLSEVSRKKIKKLDKRQLLSKARDWLKINHCSFGFIGHYHIDLSHEFNENNHKKKLFFVKSWDTPNILTFDGRTVKKYDLCSKPDSRDKPNHQQQT